MILHLLHEFYNVSTSERWTSTIDSHSSLKFEEYILFTSAKRIDKLNNI